MKNAGGRRQTAPVGEQATTRDRILDATEAVLLDVGYGGLTIRRVADAARVSVGTITYAFNKESLIDAHVERLFAQYLLRAEAIEMASDADPRQALFELVGFLVTDIRTWRTSRLFPELWAMSSHNTEVLATLAKLYTRERDWFERLLRAGWPGLPDERVAAIVGTVIALVEGWTIFVPVGRVNLYPDFDAEQATLDCLRAMLSPEG